VSHYKGALITSAEEVMFSLALICMFARFNRIVQKLLNQFSQNLVERWHMAVEEMVRS